MDDDKYDRLLLRNYNCVIIMIIISNLLYDWRDVLSMLKSILRTRIIKCYV